MGAVIGAEEIHFDCGTPVFGMALCHVSPVIIASSIDHENIQSTKRLDRRLQHLLDRRKLRHVRWHGEGTAARCGDIAYGGGNSLYENAEFVGVSETTVSIEVSWV